MASWISSLFKLLCRAYRSYIIPTNIEKGEHHRNVRQKSLCKSFPEASQPTMDASSPVRRSAFLQALLRWGRVHHLWPLILRYFDGNNSQNNRSMLSRKKATPFLDNRWELRSVHSAVASIQRAETQDGRFECEEGQFPVRFVGTCGLALCERQDN